MTYSTIMEIYSSRESNGSPKKPTKYSNSSEPEQRDSHSGIPQSIK